MGFDLGKAWQIAETVLGLADASRRVLAPPVPPRGNGGELAAGGLFGQLETRLTNVMVSALKEAFDHDAARIEIERAALEDQRRRAEEALRLELVRQAGDRALTRVHAIGAVAMLAWIVSVLCLMWAPATFAGAGRIVLAGGWALLAGAVGCALAAHTAIGRWVSLARRAATAGPGDVPEGGASAAATWLLLAGLVAVGTSLLL